VAPRTANSYNFFGAMQKDGRYPSDHDCQYSPSYLPVVTVVTAALTWDNHAVLTCTASYETIKYDLRSQGSFVAFESVTVAAGNFDAVKLHYLETQTSLTTTTLTDFTEWRDMASGVLLKRVELKSVKPDIVNVAINPDQPIYYRYTTELAGYTHAASGRQKANLQRYAGAWSGAYAGGGSGNCNMVISDAGRVSGQCGGAGSSAMTIAGTIDAQGVATFNLQADGVAGPVFSGTFASPLAVTGIWSSPGFTGTWQMTHN
jgi:hypothetical protein